MADTIVREYAWYDYNSSGGTHGLGQKLANAFGLQDMTGIVAEWCWDWYGDYPDSAQANPTGLLVRSGSDAVETGTAHPFTCGRAFVPTSPRTSGAGARDSALCLASLVREEPEGADRRCKGTKAAS
jgi:formylglycine-generating enzyme required for sulfatase activity